MSFERIRLFKELCENEILRRTRANVFRVSAFISTSPASYPLYRAVTCCFTFTVGHDSSRLEATRSRGFSHTLKKLYFIPSCNLVKIHSFEQASQSSFRETLLKFVYRFIRSRLLAIFVFLKFNIFVVFCVLGAARGLAKILVNQLAPAWHQLHIKRENLNRNLGNSKLHFQFGIRVNAFAEHQRHCYVYVMRLVFVSSRPKEASIDPLRRE